MKRVQIGAGISMDHAYQFSCLGVSDPTHLSHSGTIEIWKLLDFELSYCQLDQGLQIFDQKIVSIQDK